MSLYSTFVGALGAFFQVGGPTAPGINQNSTALETRNAANNAYANHRGADPVIADDLVTKRYGDANYSGGSGKPWVAPWFLG